VVLPSIYTAAVALWPIRDNEREWKLELDIDYVGWKSVRNLDTHLSTGGTIPQPANWKNVAVLLVGTEYRWLKPQPLPDWDVALRAGYSFTQTPIPDATFNPGILGLDLHELSLGTGFTCRDHGRFLGVLPCRAGNSRLAPKAIGIDLAYRGWFFEPRTVTGNVNPTVNGSYQAIAHAGVVTLRLVY
jgi:long-chain fatty acid transport protein